ncbi:MAG: RsiV family protein [bacterium]
MSSPKQLLTSIALIAFLVFTGCRRTPTTNEQTAAAPADGQERLHPDSGITAPVETRFFEGSIGNALDLQMKLVREGEKLTGSYFYQKVGTKIDLRGSLDKDGNVTLQELDASGKQTGVFKGLWKQTAEGTIEITGDWTKPNSEKKTTFKLHQQPIEFSNGAEIISKQIKEKNKKLKYEVAAAYPQLTGSVDPNYEKFNQTIRSLINRKVSDFKKGMTPTAEDEPTPDETPAESLGSDITIGYTVALAKDDLIAIEFTVSDYEAGAAHPNSYTEVVNFDLKNGKLLKLADLFQPGAKYLQTLSTYCIQALKKQAKEQGADAMLDDDWVKKGAGAELTNYDNWTITKKGLGITFDPYQVAAYAAGPQTVTVPYSTLKDIIKPDGPVGQFAK